MVSIPSFIFWITLSIHVKLLKIALIIFLFLQMCNSSSWGVCGNFMKWLWIPHIFRISSRFSEPSENVGLWHHKLGALHFCGWGHPCHWASLLWFLVRVGASLSKCVWRRNKGGLCGYLVCHLEWKSNVIIYILIPLCWMDCKFIHSIYNSLRLLILQTLNPSFSHLLLLGNHRVCPLGRWVCFHFVWVFSTQITIRVWLQKL